jgi:hypothetical protein
MSTRATIEISDKYEKHYVYRHSDGFKENVMPDIQKAISKCEKLSITAGYLAAAIISFGNKDYFDSRTLAYEMTTGIHGDECYLYLIDYNKEKGKWDVKVKECG